MNNVMQIPNKHHEKRLYNFLKRIFFYIIATFDRDRRKE